MIKLTAITLQGQGAPIQTWEIFINPDQIQTINRETGKTKIQLMGSNIIHVKEKPIDIIRQIRKSKLSYLTAKKSELPSTPI